jgi:membrane-bound serine protease (ClpP class)
LRTLERALPNWRRRLAVVFLALAAVLGAVGSTAQASSGDGDGSDDNAAADLAPVDVMQVSGLVDEIVVDQIEQAIDEASTNGAQALILQVNTRGSVVGRDAMSRLFQRIADADVPVAIWVGPSGARLYGLPAQLIAAADATGMSPGARVGNGGTPLVAGAPGTEIGRLLELLRSDTYAFDDAREQQITKITSADEGVPNIRNMVFGLNGLEADGVTLHTAIERVSEEGNFSNEITTVRFHKLGLVAQMFHTAASPPVTYLFLLIGLCLLLFEFFTAGIGVAGVVGVFLVAMGAYGLGVLPVRGWAVALLLFAMFAFAIDVQVGIPRFWTGVGMVSLLVSSWFMFGTADGHVLRPSWLTLVVGIAGAAITFFSGMPSMVRTRFATPTIGREWMIGELGSALVDVDPDGVVQVGTSRWRARTNRALDIKAGDAVRVVAIDGITLEVEPEAGGARDYRERRNKSESTETD